MNPRVIAEDLPLDTQVRTNSGTWIAIYDPQRGQYGWRSQSGDRVATNELMQQWLDDGIARLAA
jgi:hypothetical protein